jgi:hypothetical protein
MFTLYHIKGIKWGCTNNLKERLRAQGFTEDDVCETIMVNDIATATQMEEQLNKRDMYGWNPSQNYMRVVRVGRMRGPFKPEEYKKGGSIAGKKLVEDGKWEQMRQNGVKKAAELCRRAIIVIYAKTGEIHSEWDGITTCAKELNLCRATINAMLRVTEGTKVKRRIPKAHKGFTFQYKNRE